MDKFKKIPAEHIVAILESSGVGTWAWNVQSGAIRINSRWAEIIGYSIDELQPPSIELWEKFAHPIDRAESDKQFELLFAGSIESYRCNVRMRHKQGRWVWVRDTGTLVSRTADGKPEWVVGMHVDISAEKQAEQQARATEAHLRRVIENSPTTIFVWDVAADTLKLYGERVEVLNGSGSVIANATAWWQQRVHPLDRPTIIPKLIDWVRSCTSEPLSRRYRIQGTNGDFYWLKERMQAVIEEGRVVQTIGSIINITDSVNLAERLEVLSSSIPGMIYDFELCPDGRSFFPYASEGIRLIYGCSPEDVAEDGSLVYDRIHHDDHDRIINLIQASAKYEQIWEAEYRVILPEVGEKWVAGRATPIKLPNGCTSWHGVIFDITDKKKLELELEQKQVTLERAQEIGQLGYWTSSPNLDDLHWSNKIYEILGLQRKKAKPSAELFKTFVHPDDVTFFEHELSQAVETGHYDIQHRFIRADGETRWAHQRASLSMVGQSQIFIGTMRDITQEKEYQARLEQLSETDELTQLFNRRHFLNEAQHAYQQLRKHQRATTLAILDIDFFKRINDSYGHDAGDLVLRELANYLRTAVRPTDLVARIGGEEFVLMLSNTSVSSAQPQLEKILAGIRALRFKLKGEKVQLTVTMGVTELCADDPEISTALIRADRALYQGKQNGRDQLVVNLTND